ncbi:MAG: EFR1 family ferrodoxin [Candidatus Lernaella stagnicola]|nr:EFR1 family ferrodoxin [Candidatus Lernaella stagnicola]
MAYTDLRVFFMSGTGNSQRVARWLGEHAAGAGCRVAVAPIEEPVPEEQLGSDSEQLVGLVFPTHAFTAPLHMIRFALRLPRRRAHAFVCATRAGARYWPLPYMRWVPGLAGTGPFLIALILALKGYRVRGAMSVNMPSNWIAVHPGMGPDTTRRIIADAQPRVAGFLETILGGRRCWLTCNNAWELCTGLALLYVSLLYLVIGRFFLAKSLIANERCTGCGLCAEACPVGAIRLWGRGSKRPFWTYDCESCMRCMAFCPERAIEGGHSWIVLAYFLTTVPAATFLLTRLDDFLPGMATLQGTWIAAVLNLFYLYGAVAAASYLLWWLLGFRWINRAFTYTTLTRLYRRYHEPDTLLRDLRPAKKNRPDLS